MPIRKEAQNTLKKKTIFLFLVLVCAFSETLLLAESDQESKAANLPPGMVVKKIGGANVVVPEGTRVRKEGDLNIVESTGEYAAQKFTQLEERLDKVESELSALRKDVDELKGATGPTQKPKLVSKVDS